MPVSDIDFADFAAGGRERWELEPFPWQGKVMRGSIAVPQLLFFLLCVPLCIFNGFVIMAALLLVILPVAWWGGAMQFLLVPGALVIGAGFARGIWRQEVMSRANREDVEAWADHAFFERRGRARKLDYRDVVGESDDRLQSADGEEYSIAALDWSQRKALRWLYVVPCCVPVVVARIRSGRALEVVPSVTPGILLALFAAAAFGLMAKWSEMASLLVLASFAALVWFRDFPTSRPVRLMSTGIAAGNRPVLRWEAVTHVDVRPTRIVVRGSRPGSTITFGHFDRNFALAAATLPFFLPQTDTAPVAAWMLATDKLDAYFEDLENNDPAGLHDA